MRAAYCREISVGSFTDEEAVACLKAYAKITPGTHTAVITDIVTRLGNVPLAIAMAASYFRNADEDVAVLSEQYFESAWKRGRKMSQNA